MIKAGNATIQDKGFATAMETISGVPRQSIILELPGGIDDDTLAAICSGPIQVLDEQGEVVQTHTGPFRVVSHGLKLTRTSEESDVSALAARVSDLEAELTAANNAKDSALDQLAIVSGRLSELKARMTQAVESGNAEATVKAVDGNGADSL